MKDQHVMDEIKIGDVPVDLLRETLSDGSHVCNVRVKGNALFYVNRDLASQARLVVKQAVQ